MQTIGRLALTGSPATVASQPQPRLVRAAHEFEAQLMKELLQPMASKDALFRDPGEEDGSAGVLEQFAAESLARGISKGGGFGIATGVIRELSRSGIHASSGKVTTFEYDNTAMKTLE